MTRSLLFCIATIVFAVSTTVCFARGQVDRPVRSVAKQEAKIIADVEAVLEAQRDAWNRGDVEGYMDGYARSADITFVSGDSITRGWQTVHDRYRNNYGTREKMGTLTFSDLETTVLSPNAVMLLGRWHLQRANDQPHGRFTLILRRLKQGWRIVHDHTSSAQ